MSIPKPETELADALAGISGKFRSRLLRSYNGLKTAFAEGNFDTCGIRSGRFCEVLLRWAQAELMGTYTPFGTKISNFKSECEALEQTPKAAGHESIRILIPRAISFLYTLRNKRGIGHEGGDVDANKIDAATAVRIADWCICELIRLQYPISLEEAQAMCDRVAERQLSKIWEVLGKKRVLIKGLTYQNQTLLLLYSSHDSAVPSEDLFEWTEHSNQASYRKNVLKKMHGNRLIEYDQENQMVIISPLGIDKVESELLDRGKTS